MFFSFLFLLIETGKGREVKVMLTNDNIYTEPQIKKHLTAEEHAMRRAEMARRRKNLSEKRNEEEKVTKISFPMTLYCFFCLFSFSPPQLI